MMKKLNNWPWLGLLLLLHGCAAVDFDQIKQNLVSAKPADTVPAGLAPGVEPSPQRGDIGLTRDQELQNYRRVLQSSPDHVGANLAVYDLLSDRAVDQADLDAVDELRTIYQRLPGSSIQAIPSPLLIEALVHLRRNGSVLYNEKFAGLSLSAIRENRNNPGAYMQLGNLYVEAERLEFATALLEHARKLAPGHPAVITELASVYGKRFELKRCEGDADLTEATLARNREALKLVPNDPRLSQNLANVYIRLNQPRLALLYGEKRAALEGSVESKLDLAEIQMATGEFGSAEETLRQLLGEGEGRAVAWDALGRLSFIRADWHKAFDAYTQARRFGAGAALEDTLRYAISAYMLGKADYARSLIARLEAQDDAFASQLAQHFRQQPANTDDLLAAATDACDRSQALYFLGMQAIMQNDTDRAVDWFNQVVAAREYGSQPYLGAQQVLQVLRPAQVSR